MSEENVELVRRATEAWDSGGIEALLPFYPEDVVWFPFPDFPDGSARFHGHDGIREIMAGWSESFDHYTVTLDEARDLGDKVLALGEISGTIRGSNVPVRQSMGFIVWDFRDDNTAGRARFFPTWEEALEAAGLPRGG